MKKKISLGLKLDKDKVKIVVNDITKKTLSSSNKIIKTSEIYKLLNYSKENDYEFIAEKKFDEKELSGDLNESKRLYNQVYDYLKEIVEAVKKINEN